MEEERKIWEVIMKNYRITVNGVAYDVAVEEMGEGAAASTPAPAAAPKPAAPKAAPAAAAGAGAIKINSPMPGNILSVKASAGQAVKKGDVFTIAQKIERTGTDMYKLKSGVYITASAKYVEVFEK